MPHSEATVRASVLAAAALVSWSLLIGQALQTRTPMRAGSAYGAITRSFGK